MSARRELIGTWRCPSGNGADVFLNMGGEREGVVDFEWDSPPPLTAGDQGHYDAVILPAVVRRIEALTERVGRALVIRL